MTFNPYRSRERAFTPGMLEFYLGTSYVPGDPMGNIGADQVELVVKAWLVGLQQEIAPVLPPALEWIDEAVAQGEVFGPNIHAHRSNLCQARALGGWLQDGSACHAIWQEALLAEREHWSTERYLSTNGKIVYWCLDDALAYALQAGPTFNGPAMAIELYERYTGRRKPPSLKTLRSPAPWAYALALHMTGRLNCEPADLLAAGRRMLSGKLQETWLGNGQYVRAAMWLKLVYSQHQPPLTPLETILRAYDNMHDVPRPDFLPPRLRLV